MLRRLVPAPALVVAVLLGACAGDDAPEGAVPTTTAAPTTTTTAVPCTPANGGDFVAIERSLTNGGHHLGQGFALDTPQGRYIIANVRAMDDTLLASGLVWRIDATGKASSVTPETSGFDKLVDVPPAEATAPPSLAACQNLD